GRKLSGIEISNRTGRTITTAPLVEAAAWTWPELSNLAAHWWSGLVALGCNALWSDEELAKSRTEQNSPSRNNPSMDFAGTLLFLIKVVRPNLLFVVITMLWMLTC